MNRALKLASVLSMGAAVTAAGCYVRADAAPGWFARLGAGRRRDDVIHRPRRPTPSPSTSRRRRGTAIAGSTDIGTGRATTGPGTPDTGRRKRPATFMWGRASCSSTRRPVFYRSCIKGALVAATAVTVTATAAALRAWRFRQRVSGGARRLARPAQRRLASLARRRRLAVARHRPAVGRSAGPNSVRLLEPMRANGARPRGGPDARGAGALGRRRAATALERVGLNRGAR